MIHPTDTTMLPDNEQEISKGDHKYTNEKMIYDNLTNHPEIQTLEDYGILDQAQSGTPDNSLATYLKDKRATLIQPDHSAVLE